MGINTKDLIANMLTRGQFTLQQHTTVMHLIAMHAPSRGDVVYSSSPRSMASHTAAASLSVGTSRFRDFQSATRATECRTAKQKSAYNCGTILRAKTSMLSRRCPEAKVVIKRSGKKPITTANLLLMTRRSLQPKSEQNSFHDKKDTVLAVLDRSDMTEHRINSPEMI